MLEKLHASPDDPDHIGAREEFIQIQRQLEFERIERVPNYFWLIFGRKYRYRMFVGFFIQAMAQSTGVLVVANYMVIELNKLGLTGSLPLLLLGVYNSWAAVLNYVNAIFIDRIGRIRIIVIGCVSSEVDRDVLRLADGIPGWLHYLLDHCHGADCSVCWNIEQGWPRHHCALHLPFCHMLWIRYRCLKLRLLYRDIPNSGQGKRCRMVSQRSVSHVDK